MLQSLLKLLPGKTRSAEKTGAAVFPPAPPAQLEAPEVAAFDFIGALTFVNDLPAPDWAAVLTAPPSGRCSTSNPLARGHRTQRAGERSLNAGPSTVTRNAVTCVPDSSLEPCRWGRPGRAVPGRVRHGLAAASRRRVPRAARGGR
jgi:hypothetical protein